MQNTPDQKASPGIKKPVLLLMLSGIAAAAALIYGKTGGFGFLMYDDHQYLVKNSMLRNGLNPESIIWAFRACLIEKTPFADDWNPLRVLSHLLDVTLFGMNAGKHHLMNVLLHGLNAMLVFLFLRKTARRTGLALLAAFIFLAHPVQAETVSWVIARSHILSGFFALLCLLHHSTTASRPSAANTLVSTLLLSAAVLTKSTMVVLPVLLVICDFWPLGRINAKSPSTGLLKSILNKIPLFAVSAAAGIVTIFVQSYAVSRDAWQTTVARIFPSYIFYLKHFFAPAGLGLYGPVPQTGIPLPVVFGAAGLFVAVTWFCLKKRKNFPFALAGWLWFLTGLAPVIFLRTPADRYLYFPVLGLIVLCVWAADAHLRKRGIPNRAGALAAGALILTLGFAAHHQTGYWKETETLARRSITIQPRNYTAHHLLGMSLSRRGDFSGAMAAYKKSLAVSPGFGNAHMSMGVTHLKTGKAGPAMRAFRRGLKHGAPPDEICRNLASLHAMLGHDRIAGMFFEKALHINPLDADAHNNAGLFFLNTGNRAKAAVHLEEAFRLSPRDPEIKSNLGLALN